jgi:glycerol kinase
VARIGDQDRYRAKTGLPVSTYSSALKLRWILDEVDRDPSELAFGTIDTWLLWNLTGGIDGGVHATDVTNASRTMLMDLEALDWDAAILDALGIPRSVLPVIRGSSEVYGSGVDDLDGVPIAGILGDQHAALFGQTCFESGEAKCTYGTGAFMLMHTGVTPVHSTHGLITTVAARLGGPGTPATYALEGSVAVAGSLVQWLRDDLALIDSADEIEPLARSVPDSGDVVFVPAFSGLFAPHWRPDARGVIAGLTRFTTRAHIARAALEATAYQVADLAEAMAADLGTPLPGELRVDGGMTRNGLLMQIQADILGSAVVVPEITETTALGAAYAAGLAVGFWRDLDEIRSMAGAVRRWEPQMPEADRVAALARWHKGVERSFGWG